MANADTIPAPSATTARTARPRRWFQFSLRTALLLMVLAGIFFAGFAWRRQRAQRQRRIVEELRALGANVNHKYFSYFKRADGNEPQPDDEFFVVSFMRRALGDDFASDVDDVLFAISQPTADECQHAVELIKELPHLEFVVLPPADITSRDLEECRFLTSVEVLFIVPRGQGGLSDDDLRVFENCRNLQSLSLPDQPITGSGIIHLKSCSRLRSLQICRCNIHDAALKHIAQLSNLEQLDLSGTKVTDAGIAAIELPQTLQTIILNGTGIGDVTLRKLETMPNLILISVERTKVTAEGVQRLKERKPGVLVL